MSTINERLIELRTALDINQEDFGKKISLVRSGISNMEKGIRNVSDRTIKLICQEFNVNEDWLRTGNGDMFREGETELLRLVARKLDTFSEFDRKFLTAYMKLSNAERKVLEKLMTNLFEKNSV